MKSLLKVALLFGFILLLSGTVLAQDKGYVEGGDYWVTGVGADGSDYSGGLEIFNIGDGVYSLAWQFVNPFYGVGILNGNVLSAAYGGPDCMVASYQLADSGDLLGGWIAPGQTALNAEVGAVTGTTDTSAVYDFGGLNPDGSQYQGTMTVTFHDLTVDIVQETGGSTLNGTGILQGNVVTVTFGGAQCGLIGYEIGDDGSLSGLWTQQGMDTLLTETALPINIAGTHNVNGTNPDGSEYTGTLDVTADAQVHTFTWHLANGDIPGVGIMRGNMVGVGFGGPTCSVVSYIVMPDGTLVGLWTVVGDSTVGAEIAVPAAAPTIDEGAYVPNIEGTYQAVGTNPDDPTTIAYQAQLDIIPHDNVYEIVWTFADGSTISGIGILGENTLMVGYGGDTCAVNAYRIDPTTMAGVWGMYGNSALGTETASR